MKALHLRLRASVRMPVDLSPLGPEDLDELDADAVAKLELRCGGRMRSLGELFELQLEEADDEGDARIELHEPRALVDGIGAGMASGLILVRGDAGAYAGRGMQGGRIEVEGSCGAYAGAGMLGGCLRISADAGDCLGGALPGERQGMRGGEIVVGGNAGARVAERMRRGLILVRGDTGPSCAARMIAGTVVVRGRLGPGAARGMRRGTLLLDQTPEGLPVTFYDGGIQELGFLTLMEHEIARLEERPPPAAVPPRRRWVGDLANGGLGEILVPV